MELKRMNAKEGDILVWLVRLHALLVVLKAQHAVMPYKQAAVAIGLCAEAEFNQGLGNRLGKLLFALSAILNMSTGPDLSEADRGRIVLATTGKPSSGFLAAARIVLSDATEELIDDC